MGGDGGSKSAGVVGSLLDAKGGSGRTLGEYYVVIWSVVEVWSCDCWCFYFRATGADPDPDHDPGSMAPPSSEPLVDAPLFVIGVLDLLPKWSLPCHGWRNENIAPNERCRAGFGFWHIHNREFQFGGSKRSSLRYPDMERVRYGSRSRGASILSMQLLW